MFFTITLRSRSNENKTFDSSSGDFSGNILFLNVDLLNNLIDYCKDHSGSRQIQKKYESGTEEEKNQIFDKISSNILSLAKDVFGNYVIQKILENHIDKEKNSKIMTSLEGSIQELTLHMYGCRVIQKAIEVKSI